MSPQLTHVSQLKLVAPEALPNQWGILFRHDPAVLIVSIRLPGRVNSFGRLLRERLRISYIHNEHSVGLQVCIVSVPREATDPSAGYVHRTGNRRWWQTGHRRVSQRIKGPYTNTAVPQGP